MISKIENIICSGENLLPEDIHVKSRRTNVRECRQIIMYFAKLMTTMTLVDIGDYFGLDHATAGHSFNAVNNMIETDKIFRDRIRRHENRLKVVKIDRMIYNGTERFKPLEFEVLKLEKQIFELKVMIDEIKTEIILFENFNNNQP